MSETISSIEPVKLHWQKAEEEEEAKKVVAITPPPAILTQDTISSCRDPLPASGQVDAKKSHSHVGWSQEDTIAPAPQTAGALRTQMVEPASQAIVNQAEESERLNPTPAANEEIGLFGMLANAVANLAVSFKTYLRAEGSQVNVPQTAPHPIRFRLNPFESHNLSEEDIREYRRLETSLAQWLDKADSIRRDMGMDVVFLLLMKLMIEGKKEDFHAARKQLAKSFTSRAKDLDKRLKIMDEVFDSIRNNSWWNSFSRAATIAGTAAFTAASLADSGGAALALLVPGAIGMLNQVAGDPIAYYLGKGTAFLTEGDEKIHQGRFKIALDLSLALTSLIASQHQLAASGIGWGDLAQKAAQSCSLVINTTNAVGQTVQAKYEQEKQYRTGKLTTLEGDIRDADQKIQSETKDGLKKPMDSRNELYKSVLSYYEQIDEIQKQSIRNIAGG